jgi:hypothetical protein
MGDRSYASITFYDCPPDEWKSVLDILKQHSVDPGSAYEETTFPIEIIEEELRLGSLSDACAVIAAKHPKAIFWGQQDAYYEYYGDRCIQVEEGYSWLEVDQSGHAPLTADTINKIASITPPEKLKDALLAAIGDSFVNAATEWRDGVRKPQYVINETPTLEDNA